MHPVVINLIWWAIATECVISLALLVVSCRFARKGDMSLALYCLGGSAVALVAGMVMFSKYSAVLGL